MNVTFDAWSIAALLLLLGVAYWGFRMFKQRIEDQRYREQMAELEFEANLLETTGGIAQANAQDAVFLQVASTSVQNVTAPITPDYTAPEEPLYTPTQTPRIAPSVNSHSNKTIEKLQQAMLLKGIEGHLELHGNPEGAAFLRLRNGKLALFVPHMESEAFLRQNARRADLIIMTGTDGQAFVVRPLEEFLAESTSLR